MDGETAERRRSPARARGVPVGAGGSIDEPRCRGGHPSF